ncbi:family 43 glycosylhydrolase [Capsulimonas corticalis]|nr:family 43 glycosylhydrolase [Capsulimonas corticalis]
MRRFTTLGMSLAVCALLPLGALAKPDNKKADSTLVNFSAKGLQLTRFDSVAAAIDAHDGEIADFGGMFYLYGTSYDCGYEWGNKSAPFCGFKVYTSVDLVNWTDKGFLFDARTPVWQTRCNGATYGCYRPHVIYNPKTRLYVLWINVYDNRVGYRVFTSKTPVGPFAEIAEPTLAVNNNAPAAGLNNGDHDTFVDDDGAAYLAYTDWRTGGSIVIEKLNADYTSGTGRHVESVTPGQTEAPALMKRNGKYYLLYSDPNCGYCSGTGTAYRTAPTPLGPWSEGIRISDNSSGGQPSFVSTIKLGAKVIFLYGSDLWNNGAKNEALANFYWAPLTFSADGSITPIERQNKVSVALKPDAALKPSIADLDSTSGVDGFTSYCDIGANIQRSQSFIATRDGKLSAVSFSTFKNGNPDAGLTMEIYPANDAFQPVGSALSSILILPDAIGWAPKYATVHPNISVKSGVRYAIVVKSASSGARYGCEYNDLAPYPGGGAAYSSDSGGAFAAEQNRTLMFRTVIQK